MKVLLHHYLMYTVLILKDSLIPINPSSLPYPDYLIPPNCKSGSDLTKYYQRVMAFWTDMTLYQNDLAVTTDFRSVFSEVAEKHLLIPNQEKLLFPGFDGKNIGIMK
jgi:hypothetical protein